MNFNLFSAIKFNNNFKYFFFPYFWNLFFLLSQKERPQELVTFSNNIIQIKYINYVLFNIPISNY